jgi:hypothetical protein
MVMFACNLKQFRVEIRRIVVPGQPWQSFRDPISTKQAEYGGRDCEPSCVRDRGRRILL